MDQVKTSICKTNLLLLGLVFLIQSLVHQLFELYKSRISFFISERLTTAVPNFLAKIPAASLANSTDSLNSSFLAIPDAMLKGDYRIACTRYIINLFCFRWDMKIVPSFL